MITQDLLLVKILKIIRCVLPKMRTLKTRGRPFLYSSQVMVCCFIVMAAKRLTVRGLYAFLTNEDDLQGVVIRQVIPFPQGRIPDRRTFDRRVRTGMRSLQWYMLATTGLLIKRFRLGIARLALDNRMFDAVGALWHRKDQLKGVIPRKLRNVDTTAGWGVSAYRGWVFGHALDCFVTTGKLVLPVLVTSRSLIIRGNTAIKQIVRFLPKVKRGVVSADSEYFDDDLNRLLVTTGRNLHAPSKQKPALTPQSVTYRKRKTTVEPFYERFLLSFTRGKLDRKGPQAWPYLVSCCFLYQLMVVYNLMNGKQNPLEVTHLIRML